MICCGAAAGVLAAVPITALAAPMSRLVYVKGAGAEACPEPMQLRTAVIARLGYDPFNVTASRTIIAIIERAGDKLRAKIQLVNDESSSQGVRELDTPHDQCGELIRAMALSISIAIDPDAALGPREKPASTRESPEADAAPEPKQPALPIAGESPEDNPPPASQVPAYRNQFFAGMGGQVALGQAPATELGAHLLFGWQGSGFSWSFEGLYDPYRWSVERGTEVGAEFLLASAVPCVRMGLMSLCAVGSAGMVRAAAQYRLFALAPGACDI